MKKKNPVRVSEMIFSECNFEIKEIGKKFSIDKQKFMIIDK